MLLLSATDARPAWKQVKQQGDIPTKRAGFSFSFFAGTQVYYLFAGGDDAKEVEFNDLYTYDPSASQWKKGLCVTLMTSSTYLHSCASSTVPTAGTAPAPRINHAAAISGSGLYVFGGFQDGESRGDLFKFDTRLSKWTQIVASNAPPARCNHTMTAVGDKLFVIGGRANENIVFNDVHIFDTCTFY